MAAGDFIQKVGIIPPYFALHFLPFIVMSAPSWFISSMGGKLSSWMATALQSFSSFSSITFIVWDTCDAAFEKCPYGSVFTSR